MKKYKKFNELDEYDDDKYLFQYYCLTDLMILEKNGRTVKSNDNIAIHYLLQSKLNQYGIGLQHGFKEGNIIFRGIKLFPEFPLENEPIIKQLYGFENFEVNINLRAFDDCAYVFDYNTDSGRCNFKKLSFGATIFEKDFKTMREMFEHIEKEKYFKE
ncbi:hypothetical protein [Ornithobacterium rhinotracheale]|uniref:hypothetical protein n=1 Tax=Ornithobacterium rhinotracheale TaxID=28251 RepID=UPI00129CDB6D|nr:hypothetical protein [Ornithobacterium rhinotracheale]MRJ09697.1 hypothetical protein [Ornithobacterium rhinotracheale]